MSDTLDRAPSADSLIQDVLAIRQIDAVPRILDVICRTTGMGFAAVARVTESRWVACAVRDEIAFGLEPGGELDIGTTICDEIRENGDLVVINNVDEDEGYRCHPTPLRYGFKSYISVPIRLADGRFFGTLCAIDPKPTLLDRIETVEMFKLFADLIAQHLEGNRRLAASERALVSEREASQLREQFIAVLGHDLRNPLAAVQTGTDLLALLASDENTSEVLAMIQRSLGRMTELIDNVLDFARGRLGGGLSLELRPEPDLDAVLDQVITELETSRPGHTILREIRVDRPIRCDGDRLAQMLSNLIANALTHGDPAHPIEVRAVSGDDAFEIAVSNRGATIPPKVAERLFLPFVRGSAKPGQQGLGLGLYIASEIARAHGGTLEVASADGETTFAFRMPCATDPGVPR